MVNKLITLTVFLLLTATAQAQVTAKVSQTEIYDDESLLLTVQVSPINELNPRDIEALESLFTIEQQGRQESRQTINGRTSSQVDFQFRISPKQTGTLGIPNFTVNKEQSQPIFISVLDSGKRQDSLPEDAVIFNATLSSAEPYIDQPIILNLELDYKIQFRNGGIADIALDDFDTIVLNEDQTTKTINGQTYNVYQRSYQLTPKKPGIFSVPKLRFTAEYPNQQQGRFIRFSRTVDIDPINVKGIPDTYPAGAYWLPLASLTIRDNLNKNQTTAQNDHTNWQITMVANGLPATRLPDVLKSFEANLSDDIKLYRNAPNITDNTRVESAAISFLKPGNYTLPDIKVPWWNINTDKLEWATIPARQFNVSASTQSFVQPPVQNAATQNNAPATNANTDMPITMSTDQAEPSYWRTIAVVALLGWLSTALFATWQWRTKNTTKVIADAQHTTKKITMGTLSECYQAYLATLREQHITVAQLSDYLEQAEINQLQQLEAHLYKGSEQKVDLVTLKKIVGKLASKTAKNNKPQTDSRFDLYTPV